VGSRRDRFLAATGAIRAVLRNGDIGRLELGWLAANAGSYAFLVLTIVVAYDAGGAYAAGLLGVVRAVPPTLIAPFAGLPSARWRPDRVLLTVNLGRALAVGLTFAVLAVGGPVPLVFLLAGVEAGFGGLTRPLHMSLLPWVARTPGELVASNIASSAAEGLGTLLGPAVAGVVLATSGPASSSAVTAAITGVAVLAVASVHIPVILTSGSAPDLRRSLTAGVRAYVQTPTIRLVLTSLWLQTFVRGMLAVLLVVAAIERLGIGEPGVGTLNAAIGAGGFVGAIVALSLTGRTLFSSTFALSLALWGLPLAMLGVVVDPILAVAMLAITGMSNAILDVTGFTLIQRSTPNDARVGVMGMVDSLAAATAAIGGLAASALVASLGIQVALLIAGAILPLTAIVTLPALRRAESSQGSHEAEARLLRADPLLGLLSLSIVEELAAVLRPVYFADGEYLIREGEAGDQYLIVADGSVEVTQGGRVLRQLGPGTGVGEISLLRNVPRTASVRASGAVRGLALEREAFLSAVTGHSSARAVADTIIDDHLARSSTPTPPGPSPTSAPSGS
jgi:predicted MFS family arabinose efflux permease